MYSYPNHIDHTLGLVASGKRNIRSGREYDYLFNLDIVDGRNQFIKNGDTFETLKQMAKVVKSTLSHTQNIARKLSKTSIQTTSRELWEFVYHHIQYKIDDKGKEQLRVPLRTWQDRQKGVDCDCYSIFISSILTNLGIPHAFRMTKYKKGWQHVYVVVPLNGKRSGLNKKGGYITIDAVLDRFNYEKPFTQKFDRFMKMPIEVLSGVDGCGCEEKSSDSQRPPKRRNKRRQQFRRANTQEVTNFKQSQKNRNTRKISIETIPTTTAIDMVETPATPTQAGMGTGAKWIIGSLVLGTALLALTKNKN